MLEVSELIYETCKTYLITQGKFLLLLWLFIAVVIVVYFGVLAPVPGKSVVVTLPIILFFSLIGIAGSYGVAWFGIRINTFANTRTAFAAFAASPIPIYAIPLKAGMSIGMVLISVELLMMLIILLFIPGDYAGPCFIGFAIGESLGAAALRIAGGIFTKIADIGSDLMKIVFNIKEDDARNPGVIADCTGDNAGDSVGPTADGFETYGVTGVALITFILLAVRAPPSRSSSSSGSSPCASSWSSPAASPTSSTRPSPRPSYGNADEMNFEAPLTIARLDHLASSRSSSPIVVSLAAHPDPRRRPTLWWKLSTIITCGTLAGAIIPEVVKVFTSTESRHVREVVTACAEGGASLNILTGLVAGNFSAFWMGIVIVAPDGHRLLRHQRNLARSATPDDRRLAGLRLRPRRLRLPRHGPGHHRRRQLRPGHRQRPERLRALADRDRSPTSRPSSRREFDIDVEFRAGQAPPRGERRRRQHLQGHRQARAHRHRRRRRHHA